MVVVWHQVINALICVESPGHHAECVPWIYTWSDLGDQYECRQRFLVAYFLELVYDHYTGVGHQQF